MEGLCVCHEGGEGVSWEGTCLCLSVCVCVSLCMKYSDILSNDCTVRGAISW